MLELKVNNETSQLKTVVLGIADSFGGLPELVNCYDPKSKEHVLNGTFPEEPNIKIEINEFLNVLNKYDVKVFRPENINNLNQIFTRDIAFVIDDKLILSNILSDRKEELKAIDHLLSFIAPEKIISLSDSARIEGGDVILYNDYVFIGYSEESDFNDFTVARTNKEGVIQIQKKFPNKKVKSFELVKSDTVAKNNSLHLDCCFQPIGKNKAIIYEGGFKNIADIQYLNKLFGANNLIKINQDEMYEMNSNIFSISENVIVSEKNFIRLNQALINHGFLVEEIAFSEISKMEGLLRCSTMPLIRI
jgi:N-dimethylarginine dimethylaminohydrolase|tara:strand:+ start:4420 stop:5334 length:915 start_codon:yes stop_codon:yes gene_type:complete